MQKFVTFGGISPRHSSFWSYFLIDIWLNKKRTPASDSILQIKWTKKTLLHSPLFVNTAEILWNFPPTQMECRVDIYCTTLPSNGYGKCCSALKKKKKYRLGIGVVLDAVLSYLKALKDCFIKPLCAGRDSNTPHSWLRKKRNNLRFLLNTVAKKQWGWTGDSLRA